MAERAQTLVEKIAQAHMTQGPSRPLRAGDMVTLRPRSVLTHDNTAAVLKKFEGLGVEKVHDPTQPMFALDHDIQNQGEENLAKYRRIEGFAAEQGITFYPAGCGIGHQLMVSRGHVVPGSLCVGSDSHSNMYGALGALGTPIVRTDAAAVWATGEFWWAVPRTIRVHLEGEMPDGVTGKDLILTLCNLYDKGEALNAAVEFTGPGLAGLDMDSRMSIANMTTEWGALAGIFPVDEVTIGYMKRVKELLDAVGEERFTDADLERWADDPPRADDGANYAGMIRFDLHCLEPFVTGPHTVQTGRTLSEIAVESIPIQKAYLLSCVNSRLEDLRAAARVVKGQKVAPGVEFYIAAASADIQAQAEEDGSWQALVEAGARVLPPGCGPCIGLGQGLLEPGEVAISATNRNFKGRMGSRDAEAYLASPLVVAASAVAGTITGPERTLQSRPTCRWNFETPEATGAPAEKTSILDGFPARVGGRCLFLPADNLNTDGIYGKDHTYRELSREEMAKVVMENYDPDFAAAAREGDVLVAGANFGTGSSREQAATALQAKGIAMVIAESFSQTYLRNAFNNGFVCIECPPLVQHLRQRVSEGKGSDPTVVFEEGIVVDFGASRIDFDGETFTFAPLGEVPQSLVVAGGVENKVRQQLGLS